jgi:hypothetical protein
MNTRTEKGNRKGAISNKPTCFGMIENSEVHWLRGRGVLGLGWHFSVGMCYVPALIVQHVDTYLDR